MKRLVDKKGADASGVCSFMYRGYEISSSNKRGYWDIVVFDNSGQVARDGCVTVEDAIDWVNEQTSDTDVLTQLEKAVAIIGAILDRFSVEPPEACKKDFVEMVETIKKARGKETVTS